MNSRIILSSIALAAGLVLPAFSQSPPRLQFPAASPACTLKQRVGLTDIEIVYSRPSAKGRTIFGGLVPYGQVWRTGANQPTKITFSTPVKLNDADIPAGTYALYTIPGPAEWTVIIYKNTALWGAGGYTTNDDLVRIKATPFKLVEELETFTIEWNDLRDESATLYLAWEHTVVPIALKVEVVKTLVPQIEKEMSGPGERKPYYQAASFYYENGLDMQKARQWIDAALAQREAYYMWHLKAKILARLDDKAGAIAAAKRSSELAIKDNQHDFVKLNDDLIANLK